MTALNIPKIFRCGSERGQVTCRRLVPGRACVEPRVCPIKSPYKAILPDAGATDERERGRETDYPTLRHRHTAPPEYTEFVSVNPSLLVICFHRLGCSVKPYIFVRSFHRV